MSLDPRVDMALDVGPRLLAVTHKQVVGADIVSRNLNHLEQLRRRRIFLGELPVGDDSLVVCLKALFTAVGQAGVDLLAGSWQ